MTDLEPHEVAALEYAAGCGGEYLDSIGKTDLAELTPEEWMQFNQCVALAFLNKRIELMPCPF